MGIGAAIGGIANAAGDLIGGQQQAGANQQAANYQQQQYQQERTDLTPYMNTGVAANSSLNNLTGINGGNPLQSPLLEAPSVNLNQAALSQTPGYQFNLTQGLKAVQNSAAARGLGSSGAALKGAATYATGLADSTYQNQFNNAVTNQTNQFNRLLGLTQLGQNSAAGVGAAGIQTGSNVGQSLSNVGSALGASTVGAAGNVGNAYLYNALLGSSNNNGGLASDGNPSGSYTANGISWNPYGA